MVELPFVFISLIVSCLLEDEQRERKPRLKPASGAQYKSISRVWKDSVELNTFSSVKAPSNDFSRSEAAVRLR